MAVVADVSRSQALINDLYNVEDNGKAEIVNGEIVTMSPTGSKPIRASGKIYASLLNYEETAGGGIAYPDNAGFLVDLPNRQSFSPDAAWYAGSLGENEMAFVPGPPTFAVEVRSEGDYGPKAERGIAAKIADYFAAGALVVWDVDLLSVEVVKVFRVGTSGVAAIYRSGDIAEAEPAVPGWNIAVDRILS